MNDIFLVVVALLCQTYPNSSAEYSDQARLDTQKCFLRVANCLPSDWQSYDTRHLALLKGCISAESGVPVTMKRNKQ